MKRGNIVKLSIEGMRHDGMGYSLLDGTEIRVRGSLPGDECEAIIDRIKPDHVNASVRKMIDRKVCIIEPECSHFDVCGGCIWQHVPYEDQCRIKGKIAERAVRQSEYRWDDGIEIVPSPETRYYRNKMEFTFDNPPESGLKLVGLHARGKYNRVFDVDACVLQSQISNQIIKLTREFIIEKRLSIWGLKSHKGLLRYLVIREGKNTGEYMVNIVTSGEEFREEREYAEFILEKTGKPLNIIRTISTGFAGVAAGEEKKILAGSGAIIDKIGKFSYCISPESFFQTNTLQAFNLYETISSFAGLSGNEKVLDLYCGTGTIGIYLSNDAEKVIGIENIPAAVKDAEVNAVLNKRSNVTFINGAVEDVLDSSGEYDLAICDPPRSGIHPRGLSKLLEMKVPRIIYVSCNAGAIPRDLNAFYSAGYKLSGVKALDMAPHTPHVETVILLQV